MKARTGALISLLPLAALTVWITMQSQAPISSAPTQAGQPGSVERSPKLAPDNNTTDMVPPSGHDHGVRLEEFGGDGLSESSHQVDSIEYAFDLVWVEQLAQGLSGNGELSNQNLMVLQEMSQLVVQDVDALQQDEALRQIAGLLAENHSKILQRLVAAMQAEQALRDEWQDRILQNVAAYRQVFEAEQQKILGESLYKRLYVADASVSVEGPMDLVYNNDVNEREVAGHQEHDEHQKLLLAWQAGEKTEEEVQEVLLNSLSSQEVGQVLATGKLQQTWLHKVEGFLRDYHFVEQSGIEGEDEKQLRQQLIEQHFSAEERQIVEQFLFGV